MMSEDSERVEGGRPHGEDREARRAGREAWRDERRREREARRRERKERILHTRVSEQLSEDIRRVAEELRVPVSNLVRNVLDEAFGAVEHVTGNLGDLVEDIVEEAESAQRRMRRRRGRRHWHTRATSDEPIDVEPEGSDESEGAREEAAEPSRERPEFPDVMGWQPLLLNREQTCADCGRTLRRGKRAFVGLTSSGMSQVTLCRSCVHARD